MNQQHAQRAHRASFARSTRGPLGGLLAIALAIGGVAMTGIAPASAADEGLSVSKSVLSDTPNDIGISNVPGVDGEAFGYGLSYSCSTFDPAGCADVVLHDVLPAGLQIVGDVPPNWTVSGNDISIALGSIPAGNGSITIPVRFATDPSLHADDTRTVQNTADISGEIAGVTKTGTSQTVSATGRVKPVGGAGATKTATPGSLDEFTGSSIDVTMTGKNQGTIGATGLVITDLDQDFFDAFDVTGIPSPTLPSGATSALVEVTTDGTNWTAVTTPFAPAGHLDGVRVTFDGAIAGATGSLGFTASLRDALFSNGQEVVPAGSSAYADTANVAVSYADASLNRTASATATVTVLGEIVTAPVVTKAFSPATVVEGFGGPVSTTISATGGGHGGVGSVFIADPSTNAGVTPFGTTLILNGTFTVVWPSGAEQATLEFSDGTTATIAAPTTSFTLPVGTDLSTITGFSVAFESTSGTPIASGFSGSVTAGSMLAPGVTNGNYFNNAETDVDSAFGNSSARSVTPNVPFTVSTPHAEISTTKAFTRPSITLGSGTQSNVIQLRTVYGPDGSGTNVPADRVVVQDPAVLPTPGTTDFFDEFDITSIRAVDCGPDDAVLIEVYDGSSWVTVTTNGCGLTPLAITNPSAQGVRFTYTSASGIAAGRTFQPEVIIRQRVTNRDTGLDILDLSPLPSGAPDRVHTSPGNCSTASAFIDGGGTPADTDTVTSPCPDVKSVKHSGSGAGITKVLHSADLTDSGREGSHTALHATLDLSTPPSQAASQLVIQDPQPGDVYSQVFAAVTDLVGVGPVVVPQYERAHIEWLDASGAVIGSTPTVTGGGTLQGVGSPSFAGFRLVLEEDPADPGIEPGIESATYGSLNSIGVDYRLRNTFRDAVGGHAAGDLVRNNVCYTQSSTPLSEGANGVPNGASDCVLDHAPFSDAGFNNGTDNINDAGWILNNAIVVATYLEPTDAGATSETGVTAMPGQQTFRITNSVANAQLTKSLSPDASVSLPNTGQAPGAGQQRTVGLVATNSSGNPLTELTIADLDAGFWADFELVSAAASPIPAGTAVTYDVSFSDGSPDQTGLTSLAGIADLSTVDGITAHVSGDIPTAATATVSLVVRLRASVTAETIVTNTATVTASSPFAASQPSDATASVTVRKPGSKVSTSKTLTLAPGSSAVTDSHPLLNATVRTTNSGELDLVSVVTEDDDALDPADYPGATLPANVDRDFWNESDFVGVTTITPPTGAETVRVEYYDGTAWQVAGDFAANAIDLTGLNATLSGVSVNGLRATYTSTSGSLISAGQFGTLAFQVRLNDQAVAGTAIVNCAESGYSTGGPLQRLSPACAGFTPTAGTPQVSVSKVFSLSGQRTGMDAAGTTQRYTIVVRNTGTQNLGSHGFAFEIDDVLPATLSYQLATANPVITLPSTAPVRSTLAGAPAATVVGQQVSWTWPAGQFLAPGESVTIAVSLDVASALPAGTTALNTASVPRHGTVGCAPGVAVSGDACIATAILTINASGAIRATKSIDGTFNTGSAARNAACEAIVGFVSNPCAAVTPAGSTYTWKLDLENAGNSSMNEIVLIDRLPAAGDTGAYLSAARGTEWRGTPVTPPAVISALPSGVAVVFEYLPAGADLPACLAEVADASGTRCAGWVSLPSGTPIPADAQALRIDADYGAGDASLAPGDRLTVTWDETAPLELTTTDDTMNSAGQTTPDGRLIEWNSFGFRANEIGSGLVYRNESTKAAALFDSTTFRVTKAVENGTIAPTSAFGDFTVDYECTTPDGPPISGQLVLGDGESSTVTLPTTTVCTLSEENAPSGANWSAPDGDPAMDGYQLVLNQPFTTLATTLTNPIPGQRLTIVKSVLGEVPAGAEFDFTVECAFAGEALVLPDGADYSLGAAGGTITIDGLPTGSSCVVTETETGGAVAVTLSDSNDGEVDADAHSIELTVPDGGDQVEITNNFGTNGIVISKDVVGTVDPQIDLGEFTIELVCSDPVSGPRSETVDLRDAESATLDGFADGTTCVVSEPAAGNGHAARTMILVDGEPTADGAFAFPADGLGVTIQIVVENEFDTGSISIHKDVVGDTDATVFSFTVDCTWFGHSLERVVEVADGGSASVAGIPVGAECTIVESDAGQTSVVTDVDGPYTIAEAGQDISVQAVNHYDGELVVTKLVTNDTILSDAAIGELEFAFQVDCSYEEASVLSAAFELHAGESASFTGVPVGSQCSLVETDPAGATHTSVTITNEDSAVTEGAEAAFTIAPGTTSATVTNDYAATAIAITKITSGRAPIGGHYGFALSCTLGGQPVDLSGVDGITVNEDGTATFLLAGGATLEIDGLPIGTVCDVAETAALGALTTIYTVEGRQAATTATDIELTPEDAGDDGVRMVRVTNVFPVIGTPRGPGDGDLAFTGSNPLPIGIAAIAIAMVGAALVIIRRLRRDPRAE